MSLGPESALSAPVAALRLDGADALALLHRLSTAFLADLAPGEGRATLFCDFRGRLLHRAWVARDPGGAIWLLRPDAKAAELAAFIDRHVFREQVRIEDATGAQAAPGLPDTERFASELARIRAGHPRHGHEIAEAFTPFEINRAHEVHLQKGCFTGQEALMRLLTYRSVRRRLALVEGAGPPPAPAHVRREAASVGRLTSTTSLQAKGSGARWIGLAVLAHDAAERHDGLRVEGGAELERVEPFPILPPAGLP